MKFVLATSVILLVTSALAGVEGHYSKKNGDLIVRRGGSRDVRFEMTSIAPGGNLCDMEGVALMVNARMAAFVDQSSACRALLDFSGGGVSVSTKNCADRCGMNAWGTMDGFYSKSQPK